MIFDDLLIILHLRLRRAVYLLGQLSLARNLLRDVFFLCIFGLTFWQIWFILFVLGMMAHWIE